MSDMLKKRFWKDAKVQATDLGYAVLLDGREVRTPAKSELRLPNRKMAQAIANEWQAQGDQIDPGTMPVTRTANAAIDKVAPQHSEVVKLIAAYGESDLLCYRADSPRELVQRQNAAWDPLLNWAGDTLSVPLKTGVGIMPVNQPETSLTKLRHQVGELDAFQLAAFHDLVSLSGSLIIGFAAIHKHLPVSDLWSCARIDEDWQSEQWGADDEASATSQAKKAGFDHAARFYFMVN